MKKSLLLLILFITSTAAFTQKLVEDSVDDFTNKNVKITSWERLTFNHCGNNHFRFSKIDDLKLLELKMMIGKVFSIDEDAKLMFKLDNDQILTLYNSRFVVSELGAGATGLSGCEAPGIQTTYLAKGDDLSLLAKHKVVKVRIYTNDGYSESEIKSKVAARIQNAYLLIND